MVSHPEEYELEVRGLERWWGEMDELGMQEPGMQEPGVQDPGTQDPCPVRGEEGGVGISTHALLLSMVGVACVEIDETGEVTRWDGSAEALFGYDEGQVRRGGLARLVPSKGDLETLATFLKSSLRGEGGHQGVSTSCVTQGGRVLFCRWHAVPVVSPSREAGLAVMVKNVTDEVLIANDLHRVRAQVQGICNKAPIGIFQADIHRRIVVANPELSWMLGYESSADIIASITEVASFFMEPEQADSFLFQLYEGDQLSRFRCRLRRRDGGSIWALCYGQIIRNAKGRRDGFYGFCIDISRTVRVEKELMRANHELRIVSILDGLTRISNRRHFDECMALEWTRHIRENESLTIILCDIDYFKRFNDSYGHQAGDAALIRIAQAISACVHRSGDLVARYGGEEFVVILPFTEISGGRHVGEVIRRAVEELAMVHEGSETTDHVTLSLGVASISPQAGAMSETLIRMADRALYAAKEMGRNRCIAFEEIPQS